MALHIDDYNLVKRWIDELIKRYADPDTEKNNTVKFVKLLEDKFSTGFINSVDAELKTSTFEGFAFQKEYNLLHISIVKENHLLFDWCITNKFSPTLNTHDTNTFSKDIKNPITLSVYEGNLYALNTLIRMKVDPFVRIYSTDSDLANSTLLHRVMMERDIPNKLEVIKILSSAYPDLNVRTHSGKSIFDCAVDDVGIMYLKELAFAKREKTEILKAINIVEGDIKIPKKRL